MKKTNGRFLMAIGIIFCALLFLRHFTGDILHAVFGLLLLIIAFVHVGRNWKKFKYKKKSVQMVDWIIMIALVVLVLSGILLHPLRGMLVLKIVHKLAAVIFVVAIMAHAGQNGKRFSHS